jgi:hypothetical protein
MLNPLIRIQACIHTCTAAGNKDSNAFSDPHTCIHTWIHTSITRWNMYAHMYVQTHTDKHNITAPLCTLLLMTPTKVFEHVCICMYAHTHLCTPEMPQNYKILCKYVHTHTHASLYPACAAVHSRNYTCSCIYIHAYISARGQRWTCITLCL